MAVQVGNSWVSEEAYAYAKAKANINAYSEGERESSVLDKLSQKYPDIQFGIGTKPFSGTGKNNISIAPNILKEMENNPDKRLEYEALIYDCNQAIKNMPDKTPNGSTIKSFGFIINSDGSLGAWSISESGGDTKRNRYSLDKNKKDSWLDEILEKRKQKKIEDKKKIKAEEQEKLQEKLIETAESAKNRTKALGSIVDLKA